MAVRFSLTIGCADPDRLTGFWAEALGYRLKDPPVGFVDWLTYFRSSGAHDDPPEVRVQRVQAAAQRLVEAGGTIVRDWGDVVTMQDPQGNEFDLNQRSTWAREE